MCIYRTGARFVSVRVGAGCWLTPQLLPAIIIVNLAKGSKTWPRASVVVKLLTSIENFGSMDVLCLRQAGKLTEGRVRLESAVDVLGRESERVFLHAYVNASFKTGYANPIDNRRLRHRQMDLSEWGEGDEIPYDSSGGGSAYSAVHGHVSVMVTKGAGCRWCWTHARRLRATASCFESNRCSRPFGTCQPHSKRCGCRRWA